MLDYIKFFFISTLKRQLITSVALVHAVLMALFVWDLTIRQKELLLERQVDHTQALVQSIATSSAGWVAAKDYSGLQEIISAQSRYSELEFAMILDIDGRVLAHTDVSFLGQYVQDLPTQTEAQLLSKTAHLVDAINPIILANTPIGWVRVGLGQKTTAERLKSITIDGIIYAFIAILIGSLLAFFMANRLTQKLRSIQACADAVKTGSTETRAIVMGTDEVSHVATAFNTMLDSMIDANKRVDIAKNAAQLGIFDFDIVSQELIWDNWMFVIYGISPDKFKGNFEDWSQSIHPDDIEQATNNLELSIKEGKNFNTEFRIIRPDGAVRWIKADATVIKDNNNHPLRMIGINQDITEKKEKEQIIEQQANYDALTLLPNRKLLNELLKQEIRTAKRNQLQIWVLFFDLDGFKEVNDTWGHPQGDKLLIEVARRLKENVRDSDIVARLGGDEFVVILSNAAGQSYVDLIASKLIESVAQSYQLDDSEVFISTSIGISSFPNDTQNIDDLLRFADQSMYEAKSEGKNRYSYFTPELQKKSLMHIELSTLLRQAISNNELQLFYQPIVNLATNQIYKAEALIRWFHPKKGTISPATFIPIAEETGIICDIGVWIFDTAFSQLCEWKQSNALFELSINMSPYQLRLNEGKYDDWLKKLDDYQLTGQSVVIEITEGLLLKSDSLVSSRLLDYRDKGVQVAIDDFGTGYSSLSYLKEFDIDYLKIDQSFTRNLHKDSSEHALSEAIIVMAHKLGLKVIAEGIETLEQLNLLKEMGCDYGQGYYFSRPIDSNTFNELYITRV